jgi:hypothetical protein
MDDPQQSSTNTCGKEGTLAGHKRGTCLVAILLLGLALALAWMLIQGPVTTYLRESQLPAPIAGLPRPTTPEANDEPCDAMAFLPPGTVLSNTLQADLDGDGLSERVLVFNDEENPYGPGMGGVVLTEDGPDGPCEAYESRPPSEGRVTDAAVRDINMDGILELLIYKSSEDRSKHYLHIYQWDDSGFVSLAPRGGPLHGAEAFVSAYYAPEVRNVDSMASEEIVAFEDDASSERLKAIVYRWDGSGYTRVDWIIMLGPPNP